MSAYRMRRDSEGRHRKVVVEDGIEGFLAAETSNCTGCTEYSDGHRINGPCGCHECGYTGRRRSTYFVPFPETEAAWFAAMQKAADGSGTASDDRAWLLVEIEGARDVLATIQSAAAEGVTPAKFGEHMRAIYDTARARKLSLDSVLRVAGQFTPEEGSKR